MILDTSAVVAIIKNEPEAETFLNALFLSDEPLRMSAASYLESAAVLDSDPNQRVGMALDDFIGDTEVIIEPITENQARLARRAMQIFGRGSGSKAKLNFGDCFTYALAKDLREPLLYKGNDFLHTDVRSALQRSSSE